MKKLLTNPTSVAVFIAVAMVSFVLLPQHILSGGYKYLGVIFVIMFALNMSCMVNVMSERAKVAKAQGAGLLGIIATAVGFISLQMCGVGGPLCGALFGSVVFASILPAGSLGLFTHYAVYIVMGAIVVQALSLLYLGCLTIKK